MDEGPDPPADKKDRRKKKPKKLDLLDFM